MTSYADSLQISKYWEKRTYAENYDLKAELNSWQCVMLLPAPFKVGLVSWIYKFKNIVGLPSLVLARNILVNINLKKKKN